MDGLLVLRVSPTGSRSWLVEARNAAGRKVQRAFGTWPAMDLVAARKAAAQLEAEIATEGREEVKKSAGVSVRDALEDWRRTHHPKPDTFDQYLSVLRTHASDWLDRPFRAIKRAEVIARCEKVWSSGAVRQGDILFQTLRALANKAGIVPNPAAGIKPKGKKSDVEGARPLAPEALPALLEGIENLKPQARMYYWTLLFTGFRPAGAKHMEWQYVRFGDRPVYNIPPEAIGFKKGGAWGFPLSRPLADELQRWKRYCDRVHAGSRWVFPGQFSEAGADTDGPQQRTEGSLKKLRTLSGLPGLIDYDMRDTWGSYLQALFQKNFITDRLLDHRIGGTSISAMEIGLLYATAIPASFDSAAQLQVAASDEGEALRPLVDAYADAILFLAGRGPAEASWTEKQQTFYRGVKRVFLERNPQLSVEKWLTLAAVHPQVAFAPETVLQQMSAAQAMQVLKPSS